MDFKVSVLVITYNHEKYVSDALDGILMQKTNFNFEIVIGEDFSKDRTRAICEKYAQKYSHKIKLLPSNKNHGIMPNFIRTYSYCIGNYIALCEGDDYWIDPNKLQRQVDFLERNKNIVLITENAKISDGKSITYYNGKNISRIFNQKDLILSNQCITCTVLFRKCIKEVPDFFKDLKIGDYPLFLLLLNFGMGYHSNKVSALYRIHEGGIYTSMTPPQRIKNEIKVFETLKENNCINNKFELNLKIQTLYYSLLINDNNYSKSLLIKNIIKNFNFLSPNSYLLTLKSLIRYIYI